MTTNETPVASENRLIAERRAKLAALRGKGEILIHDCANVATSFPNFLGLAAGAGIRVAEEGK